MDSIQSGRFGDRVLAAVSRRAALRRVAAGGLAAGMAIGLERHTAGAQFSLGSAATEAAARRAVAAINRVLASGDMSLLDAAFSAGYVNHTPRRSLATGQLFSPDLAGLKVSLGELRSVVPDAVVLIGDVIASPDKASVRATFRGTLVSANVGQPESPDRLLRIAGVAFGRLASGQVVESWDYDEAAEVLGALTGGGQGQPVEEPVAPDARGETRDVRDFQQVALEGVGTLSIDQGDTESLTIDAEPRVLRRIETSVQNGKLTIRPDRSFTTRDQIVYSLSVKQLNSIELSGAGRVEAGQLTADQLRLQVSGASAVQIDALTATVLDVTASGNMEAALAGTVDSQTVVLSGAGSYLAQDLASRIASVTVEGAASAIVRVSESLDARASGAGRIEYIGDPTVSQDISAAASVTKVG